MINDLKQLGIGDVETDVAKLAKANVDNLIPQAIVTPNSAEAAGTLLAYATQNGLKVSLQGNKTQTSLGNVPDGLDLVLSTQALNAVTDYNPADLVVGVQAGLPLANLQAILAKNNQFLPIEATKGATIGGAIATNASGALRLSYGPARDWLIGIKFVLANGTLAKAGGKVVKNVAGFDMMKLFVGSLGSLGLIHEMYFKLMPLPTNQTTLIAAFPDAKVACQTALKLIEAGLFPTALTLLNQKAAARLNLPPQTLLLIQIRNTEHASERQVREIAALCVANTGKVDRLDMLNVQNELWQNLIDITDQPLTLKVSTLPDQCATMLESLAAELDWQIVCHCGHGLSWLSLDSTDENVLKFIKEFTFIIEKQGGSVVVNRIATELKTQLGEVWGNALSVGELRLMRELKAKFDPNKTLNGGRFVGKI